MNKVILIGRLGKDVEVKTTTSGLTVTTIQLATEERTKDKEGKPLKLTEWHRCKLFGKTAELATQYLLKGDSVCLEGRLQTSKWEEKGGTAKYVTEVIVSNMEFLSKGAKSAEKEIKQEKIEANKNRIDNCMKDMASKIFNIPKEDTEFDIPF